MSRPQVAPKRTALPKEEERKFQSWYRDRAQKAGISLNPDEPGHKYDYRGAYLAGQEPEINATDGLYHWSSQFKDLDHPNRYVGGVDTITGKPTQTFSGIQSGSSTTAPSKLSIKDFAGKIKAKYPDYASVDDLELTRKIVAKYPEYQDAIDVRVPQQPAKGVEPSAGDILKQNPFVRGAAESYGVDPDSPILGTAKNIASGTFNTIKNVGSALMARPSEGIGGALVREAGVPMAKGMMAAPTKLATGIWKNDADEIAHGFAGTLGTATQLAIPGTKTGARISNKVADLPAVVAQKASAKAQNLGVPSKPEAAFFKGIKPYARKTDFYEGLNRSMPELKASEAELGRPIKTIDDVLEGTKAAKKRVWAQYEEIRGPQADLQVDLSPVADAMEASLSKKAKLENPELAEKVAERAAVYRNKFSVTDVDDFLQTTNAELEAYYGKYPASRHSAIEKNPETAIIHAQGVELRKRLYGALDPGGDGAAPRELKKRYGALMELEQEAFRRKNVSQRAAPESLTEQLSRVGAAMQVGKGVFKATVGLDPLGGVADIVGGVAGRKMASTIKKRNTTDFLIESALKRYDKKPQPVSVEPRSPRKPPKALLRARNAVITPGPEDTSFVRGVNAEPARRVIRGLLPEARKAATPLPAPDTTSFEVVDAKRGIARDPKTGRMFRFYTSDQK